MRKNLFGIVAVLLITLAAHGQETILYDAPVLGQNVKDFPIKIYNEKGLINTKLSAFAGKVVILEFWATYCRPCLPAMDHLGELQKQFANQLKVIAITDEDAPKIQWFLSKRPTNLAIGVDTDKKLNDMFYHQFMPHTVVIDPNGVLKAVTSPDQITAEVISKIYSGVDVAIKPKAEFAPTEEAISQNVVEKEISSLFKLAISAKKEGVQSQINPKSEYEFEFINCTIPFIYKYLYQVNQPKMESGTCLEVTDKTKYLLQQDQLYCFTIKVPEALKGSLGEIGIRALEEMFAIKPKFEVRNRKVYALVADQKSVFDDPNKGHYMTLKTLLKTLEGQGLVDLPIVNESGVKDDSVVYVERLPKEVEAVEGTLAKLGFRLTPKEREAGCVILYDSITARTVGIPTEDKPLPPVTKDLEKDQAIKND